MGDSSDYIIIKKIFFESLQNVLPLFPNKLMIKLLIMIHNPEMIDNTELSCEEQKLIHSAVRREMDKFFQMLDETGEALSFESKHSNILKVLNLKTMISELEESVTNGFEVLSRVVSMQYSSEKSSVDKMLNVTSNLLVNVRKCASCLNNNLIKNMEFIEKFQNLLVEYQDEVNGAMDTTETELAKYNEVEDFENKLQEYCSLQSKISNLQKIKNK